MTSDDLHDVTQRGVPVRVQPDDPTGAYVTAGHTEPRHRSLVGWFTNHCSWTISLGIRSYVDARR